MLFIFIYSEIIKLFSEAYEYIVHSHRLNYINYNVLMTNEMHSS